MLNMKNFLKQYSHYITAINFILILIVAIVLGYGVHRQSKALQNHDTIIHLQDSALFNQDSILMRNERIVKKIDQLTKRK